MESTCLSLYLSGYFLYADRNSSLTQNLQQMTPVQARPGCFLFSCTENKIRSNSLQRSATHVEAYSEGNESRGKVPGLAS